METYSPTPTEIITSYCPLRDHFVCLSGYFIRKSMSGRSGSRGNVGRHSHGRGSRGGRGSHMPNVQGLTPEEAAALNWTGAETYTRGGRGDWGSHAPISAQDQMDLNYSE